MPQTDSRGAESGLSWRLALGLGALPGILLLPFKTSSRAAEPTSVAADCLDGRLVLNGHGTVAAELAMSMSEPPEVPMLGTTTPTTLLQARAPHRTRAPHPCTRHTHPCTCHTHPCTRHTQRTYSPYGGGPTPRCV